MRKIFLASFALALLSFIDKNPFTAPSIFFVGHNPPSVTPCSNQLIVLPAHTATVSASYNVEGSIVTTKWTRFKVPGQSLKKVVVLGSSTSLGTGTTHIDSSYVGRLKNFYVAAGIASSFVNLSNTGSDLGAALPTGTVPPTGLSNPDPIRNVTAALGYNPHVVIVNFPSNGYTNAAVTPTVVAEQMQLIFNILNAAGVKCYITTTQSRIDFSMADRIKLQVIRDTLINRFGEYCINFYNGLTTPGGTTQIPEYASGDGIHFNNLGHERLFQLIKAANIFQHTFLPSCSITDPVSLTTDVFNLTTGASQYQLAVIDADGLAASAVTQVIVTPGLLPVKLLDFSVHHQNGKFQFNWVTVGHSGHDVFEIEESQDGSSFSMIGRLNAKASSERNTYNFNTASMPGVHFFRLKIIEGSGGVKYSSIIRINIQDQITSYRLLGNPIRDVMVIEVYVTFSGNYSLEMIDNSGRIVYRESISLQKGSNSFQKQIHSITRGLYRVRLYGAGMQSTSTATVIKE